MKGLAPPIQEATSPAGKGKGGRVHAYLIAAHVAATEHRGVTWREISTPKSN